MNCLDDSSIKKGRKFDFLFDGKYDVEVEEAVKQTKNLKNT